MQVAVLKTDFKNENIFFGFSVPKKKIPKAVKRNLIKRLLKESVRLQKNQLSEHMNISNYSLHVFLIWQSKKIPDFEWCFSEIEKIFSHIIVNRHKIPAK